MAKMNLTLQAVLDEARAIESSNRAAESLQKLATVPATAKPMATVHENLYHDEKDDGSGYEVYCSD